VLRFALDHFQYRARVKRRVVGELHDAAALADFDFANPQTLRLQPQRRQAEQVFAGLRE